MAEPCEAPWAQSQKSMAFDVSTTPQPEVDSSAIPKNADPPPSNQLENCIEMADAEMLEGDKEIVETRSALAAGLDDNVLKKTDTRLVQFQRLAYTQHVTSPSMLSDGALKNQDVMTCKGPVQGNELQEHQVESCVRSVYQGLRELGAEFTDQTVFVSRSTSKESG